jgi:hypothetical protein
LRIFTFSLEQHHPDIGDDFEEFFSEVRREPTQFINTPVTAELCAKVKDLNAWSDSINASIETGAQYSSAIPLYGDDSEDAVNESGQLYYGPVVLVTDALCYSATDFFAAGFQDHEIGTVLGRDRQGARRHQHGHGPAGRLRPWRPGLNAPRRVRRRQPGRRGHPDAQLERTMRPVDP